MPERRILEPEREKTGQRLDCYLSEALEVTRSAVQNWLEQGLVRVNGRPQEKNYRLREGDRIVGQSSALFLLQKPEQITRHVPNKSKTICPRRCLLNRLGIPACLLAVGNRMLGLVAICADDSN